MANRTTVEKIIPDGDFITGKDLKNILDTSIMPCLHRLEEMIKKKSPRKTHKKRKQRVYSSDETEEEEDTTKGKKAKIQVNKIVLTDDQQSLIKVCGYNLYRCCLLVLFV